MTQVAAIEKKNVLCVFRNPPERPQAPPVAQFRFLGYDLVDVQGMASALTNYGGFPDVFANSELSSAGLLPDLERAIEVQAKLRSVHLFLLVSAISMRHLSDTKDISADRCGSRVLTQTSAPVRAQSSGQRICGVGSIVRCTSSAAASSESSEGRVILG